MVAMPQQKPASRETTMSAKKDQAKKAEATKAKEMYEATLEAAPGKEKTAKTPKAKAEPKPKKMSALDAAAKVLGEQGKPMNCIELIDEMSRKNYWTSPNGATPQATLYAAIMREVKTKGKDARFVKAERGKFGANA
jgi:hypothetical protein